MNKKTVVTILALLLIVYGTIFGLKVAFGEEYINAGNGIWDHPPKICISPPDAQKWYTLRSLDIWRQVWYNYTGNNNLNFSIATIHPYPQMKCDIELVNGNPQVLGAKNDALGATACLVGSNGYFIKCLTIMYFSHDDWYSTVQHEIGHTLGLGHRLATDKDSFVRNVLSNDIMFPISQPFSKITMEDFNALKQNYGINGFINDTKVFIPKNYTIINDK